MDETTLGLLLLRVLVAFVTAGLAAVAWLTASTVSEGFDVASRGWSTLARIAGLFLAAIGWIVLVGLTATGLMATFFPEGFLPHVFLAALFVGVLTSVTTWVLFRCQTRIKSQFAAWMNERGPLDDRPQEEFPLGAWVQTPLGIVTLLVFAAAFFAGLWSGLSLGLFEIPHSEEGLVITCAAVVAELMVLSGIALLTAVELEAFSDELLTAQERLTLSQLLTAAAMVYLVLTAIALSWMGMLLVLFGIVFTVSTLGGRKRASQLAVFWTLTNVVQSGRPAEAELRVQARSSLGRTRRLLKAIARRLQTGDNWSSVVCRREIAPQSAWLELHSALASGALAAAMNAAATRETIRFARQSDPTTPRVVLGYFGIVSAVLIFGLSFLGYSIVPKLKKIIEDFDVDLPPLTDWLFRMTDNGLVPWLAVLGFLLSVLIGGFGEMAVDFYGWHGAAERLGLSWSRRRRTPDLLRGLRWGVIRGQPLDSSLQAMAEAPISFSTRSQLHQAAASIREGYDPWETLQKTHWLNRGEVELLQSAQAAGNLPWALETLSEAIVAQSDYRLEWWLQLLHPVMVLFFGLVLAVVGVGLMMPLFHLIGALA